MSKKGVYTQIRDPETDDKNRDDETARQMTQMGYFGWRPQFLECFNKPVIFAIVFAMGSFFMPMPFGNLTLILPTLESVFNLNSKETGFIFMSYGISGTFGALLMGNYCSARKSRWIGLGMMLMALATFMPCIAAFLAEYPQPGTLNEIDEPANNQSVCNVSRSDTQGSLSSSKDYAVGNHKFYGIIILGSLLMGLGNIPAEIAGPTYIDEIFTQKNYGIAMSLLFLVLFLGYSAALFAGGIFLQLYVTLNPPPGMTLESKEWVGAWWILFLFPAIVLFLLSIIVLLYPRQMPAAKNVLEDKVKKGITTVHEKKEEIGRSLKEITTDMLPAIKRAMKNKALMCLIFGDIFNNLQLGEYFYVPKIYAMMFRLDSVEVGKVFGLSQMFGLAVGLAAGGMLMKIKEWQPRQLQLAISIISLVAIPFTLGFLLYCPTITTAGVDLSYSELLNVSQPGPPSLIEECNSRCGCTTAFYQPVCDEGATYFSPCHAGCREVKVAGGREISYSRCTCTSSGSAAPGECGGQCPTMLWSSIIITTVGTSIGMSVLSAVSYTYNRVVSEADRTFAQGLRTCFTRAFGILPAPVLFGWIFDEFCDVWRVDENGMTGNCWLYDLDNLISTLVFVRVALRLPCVAFYLLAWWWYPNGGTTSATLSEDEHEMAVVSAQRVDENGTLCEQDGCT